MENVQIYVNVNSDGRVIEGVAGEMIIPDKSYDFFFMENYDVAESIENYIVIIEGLKPKLVKVVE